MKEIRLIIFEKESLCEALEVWMRSRGEIDQYKRVREPDLKQKGKDFSLNVGIVDAGRKASMAKPRIFDAGELRDALVLYCQKRSVPLPQNASKQAQIYDGKITLMINMGKL